MIASAPISKAVLTFSNSLSQSQQSFEIPKLTFILVLNPCPTPSGLKDLWLIFAGIATFPSATKLLISSGFLLSFFATISISLVIIPFLAASICVVNSLINSPPKFFPNPLR